MNRRDAIKAATAAAGMLGTGLTAKALISSKPVTIADDETVLAFVMTYDRHLNSSDHAILDQCWKQMQEQFPALQGIPIIVVGPDAKLEMMKVKKSDLIREEADRQLMERATRPNMTWNFTEQQIEDCVLSPDLLSDLVKKDFTL